MISRGVRTIMLSLKQEEAESGSGVNIDDYTNPLWAYSLRRVSDTYSSALIRLRRASDNAESDFSATGARGTFVDWSAISTWAGGSAYVVKWYDQSGNGYDITHATAGNQPLWDTASIPFSGVSADVHFDGVNDILQVDSGATDLMDDDFTVFQCRYTEDSGFNFGMMVTTSLISTARDVYASLCRDTEHRTYIDNLQVAAVSYSPDENLQHVVEQWDKSASTGTWDVNDAEYSNSNSSIPGPNGAGAWIKMGGARDNGSNAPDCRYVECLAFDSHLSSGDVDTIRNDQDSTYTMY